MRKLVWIAAWTGVAFWSLFAVATYGLFDLASTVLTGGVEARPPAPDTFTTGEPHVFEWLYPFVQVAKGFGLSAITAVWFTVSAMILGSAFLVTRFLPSGREPPPAPRAVGGRGPTIETSWVRHPPSRPGPARAAEGAIRRLTRRR